MAENWNGQFQKGVFIFPRLSLGVLYSNVVPNRVELRGGPAGSFLGRQPIRVAKTSLVIS